MTHSSDVVVQKEYFHSVERWKAFLEMEEKVALAYYQVIDQYRGSIWEDVLRIGAVKLVDITNYLHLEQKKRALRELNLEIDQLDLVQDKFREYVRYDSKMFRSAFRFRIFWWKGFLENNLRKFPRWFKPRTWYSQYSNCHSTLDHLHSLNEVGLIVPFFANLRNPPNLELSGEDKAALLAVVDALVGAIASQVSETDYALTAGDEDFFKDLLFNYHLSFLDDYRQLRSRKNLPSEIYLCSNNKTHVRMVSQAVRANGGKVIGSTHGEPLIYEWEKTTWMEFLVATHYLEYNAALAEELKESVNRRWTNWGPVPEMLHFKSGYQFNTSYSKPASLAHVKKAVMIGNYFLDFGFSSVASFEPHLQLHLERTVLQAITDLGIQTAYKKHPGGLLKNSIDDRYSDICETISAPFEEVMDEYDLIVFYYTRTSTMKAALESGKDILIVDLETEELAETSKKLLHERCFYVKLEDLKEGLAQWFQP